MPLRGGGWTPNGKCHLKFPFWFFEPLPNYKYWDGSAVYVIFAHIRLLHQLNMVKNTVTAFSCPQTPWSSSSSSWWPCSISLRRPPGSGSWSCWSSSTPAPSPWSITTSRSGSPSSSVSNTSSISLLISTGSFSKDVFSQGAEYQVFLGVFLMFLAFFHSKIWAKFHFGSFKPYKKEKCLKISSSKKVKFL